MLVLTLLLEQQQGILTKAAGISIVFQNVIYKNSNTMSFLLHNIVKSVKQVCLNAFKQEGDKSFCYGSGTYICVNGHNYIVLALLRTKKHLFYTLERIHYEEISYLWFTTFNLLLQFQYSII